MKKHPRHERRPRAVAAIAALIGATSTTASTEARADPPRVEAPARHDEAPAPDRPADDTRHRPFHLGATAGIGFPHPFAVEVLASFHDLVDVGAEYGFMPPLTIDGVRTNLWSFAGDLRLRPFRGAFFVGALVGRQHVSAATTVTVSGVGSAPELLDLDSWFVNPRVGFLWTTDVGVAIGIDAGLQIPIGATTTSSLPLSLYPSAEARVDTLGRSVLPTIDLLRVGFVL